MAHIIAEIILNIEQYVFTIQATSRENWSSGVCDQLRPKQACSADETSYGLEILAIASMRYYTIQAANNKGADQTARMRRLIFFFVVRISHKQVFL